MSAPNKEQTAALVVLALALFIAVYGSMRVIGLMIAPARWTIVTDDKGHWGFELPFGQDPMETFSTEAEAIQARDRFIVLYSKPKAPNPYIPWHEVKEQP